MAGLSRQGMNSTRSLSMMAIFSSLIIASDYALAPIYNVKLMDTLVFASAYSFGFKVGASIAILSESIWSVVNPTGLYLPIIPFLALGEVLFAFAGYFSSRMWKANEITAWNSRNIFFGAILALCAAIWDFETNIATGLLAGAHTLYALLVFEVTGIPFAISHEVSAFVFGSTLVPIVILYFRRYSLSAQKKVSTLGITSPGKM
jgi:hypothetical protein